MHIEIHTTDDETRTFEELTHILNNLIGPYRFYLEGSVVED